MTDSNTLQIYLFKGNKGILVIWPNLSEINSINYMLRWSLIFFIVAIAAAVFGFGGIAAGAASIAKILFFIFVILFFVSLVMGLSVGKAVSDVMKK